MSYALQVRNDLLEIISQMASHVSEYTENPKKDFTRNKKITFSDTLHFMIAMNAGSIRTELLKYFSYSSDTPTNSAFIQQRKKLKKTTMPFLFHAFNQKYDFSLYRDKYQLLAVDGSSFSFTRNPNDKDAYFAPDGKTTNGYNQIHLIPAFDLVSKRYTDCIIQPIRKKNEFQAICDLIDNHKSYKNSVPVFIADRGFHSFNVFAHAMEKQALFLIRATDIKTQRLVDTDWPENQDTFDIQIHRILTRTKNKKKHLQPEHEDQYKYICKEVSFDYIDGKRTEYPIDLRILRFKISEDSYENIITNLPSDTFSLDEIKELYSFRWKIETSFREIKHDLGAMNFHSKQRKYIEMEIWARLLLYNFSSIITSHVVIKKGDRKHQYQVNFSEAHKACHHYLGLHDEEKLPDIESLIGKNILPIRPNRKYARQHRFRVPVSFTYRI